ncbi:MAG: MFS transporter [Eubacteriales bacterium]|nr:MFS transporter [Eubacteriales bacterium]
MEQSNPNWKRKAILFFFSQSVTLFGSTLVSFAIVWYVTLKTSSGGWVALLTVCSFLPQTLVSFVSGALADRYSKKWLIIGSDAAIAVATLALALLLPSLGESNGVLAALLFASVIRSIGAGIQLPAVGAIIPQFVPEEHLMRVNGINATLQSVVQFAAPAAAGAILSLGTLRSTLWIDIVTAAVDIGFLACLAMPRQQSLPETQAPFVSDLKEGIRYIRQNRFFEKLLFLYGLFILLSVPGGFLASLLVARVYGGSYLNLTIVELVGFAGMTAGGVLIGVWGGFKNRVKTLLIGVAACGLLTIGMGSVRQFLLYLAMILFMGVAITMAQTAVTTLVQERANPAMQGRMFGLIGTMYSGFLLIGMSVFGPLADHVSLPLLMVLTGGALAVVALLYRFSKAFCKMPAANE